MQENLFVNGGTSMDGFYYPSLFRGWLLSEPRHTYVPYPAGIRSIHGYIQHDGEGIMSDIQDVEVIKDQNGNDRKVIVYFADGTNTQAAVRGDDKFNLEVGISICITKKLLSYKTDGNYNSLYNGIIKRAVRVHNDHIKKIKEETEAKERIEKKKIKNAAKRKAKIEAKEKAAREARIQEQAEAYARALKMVKGE